MEILGDFHVHSTYSDGLLTITQLVDFYGKLGFKALAITDHLCEEKTLLGRAAKFLNRTLRAENFSVYLNEIYREKKRALQQYGMCLIPGVEITKNSFSHRNSSHIVILGIDAYIDPDQSIEEICRRARIQNALSVAAHPVSTQKIEAQTRFLWDNRERLQPILDVWEVASGDIIFKEVLESGLSIIANSDLHHPRQMSSWKTKVYGPMSEKHILDEIKHQNLEIFFYEYNFGQEFLENVHLQKRSYVEGSVFQH